MKKKDCYLIDENSHDFATLKLIFKCEYFKRSYLLINIEKNIIIFYNIKVYKNAESYYFNKIMNKHSNV